MKYIKEEIKDGVKLHLLINENFKTDFSVIFLTIPLKKESLSKNALLPAVLRNGSKNYKDFQKITEELEMLYGASFDCGIDKTGDNIVLKFYIESINDNFLPNKNDNLKKVLKILIDIVFNPKINQEGFDKKYVEIEKRNLEMIINAQKDDKDTFAYERCINIMYENSGYGLSKYGSIEDLKEVNENNLYQYYKELIRDAKIDIIVDGNFEEEEIKEEIKANELIENLEPRQGKIFENHFKKEIKEKIESPKNVEEVFDVAQGKLVIGLDILPNDFDDFRFIAILYNSIFGNGVNSKLFQIVREKESLAYTAKSEYITQKNNMFIRCGIECEKYHKTLGLIQKLLKDMEDGVFSEEDIQKSKDYIIAGIDSISEEQDSQILFLFGQELSKLPLTKEEYKANIQKVNKEELQKFAKYVQINTVYFLRNGGENADN